MKYAQKQKLMKIIDSIKKHLKKNWKIVTAIFIIEICLIIAGILIYPSNLVKNGSFSKWETNKKIPRFWQYTQPYGSMDPFSLTYSRKYGNIAKIETNASGKQRLYQKVHVLPDSLYNFQCKVKIINRGGLNAGVRIWGSELDGELLANVTQRSATVGYSTFKTGVFNTEKHEVIYIDLGCDSSGMNGSILFRKPLLLKGVFSIRFIAKIYRILLMLMVTVLIIPFIYMKLYKHVSIIIQFGKYAGIKNYSVIKKIGNYAGIKNYSIIKKFGRYAGIKNYSIMKQLSRLRIIERIILVFKSVMSSTRTCYIIFFALIIIFFFHYYRQIHYGLPYNHAWDETQVFNIPFDMIRNGNLKTTYYAYPPVIGYFLMPVVLMDFIKDFKEKRVKDISEYRLKSSMWDLDPPYLLFHSRILFVILNTVSLLLVFLAGKYLFSVEAGFAAAIFLGVFHKYGEQIAIVHPNGLMGLMCMISFYFIAEYFKERSLLFGFIAAFFCGIAIQTKQNLYIITAPLSAALLFVIFGNRIKSTNTLFHCLIVGCGLIAGFYIGNPYFFKDRGYLDLIISNYNVYHNYDGPILMKALYSQVVNQDGGIFILMMSFFVFFFGKNWKKNLIVVSFPLLYFPFMGMQRYPNTQSTFVAIYPFLALMAGIGLANAVCFFYKGVSKITRYSYYLYVPGTICIIVLLLAGPRYYNYYLGIIKTPIFITYTAFRTFYSDNCANDDARKNIAVWINHNISKGRTIAVDKYLHFYNADISEKYVVYTFDHTKEGILDLLKNGSDYVLMGEYETAAGREFYEKLTLIKEMDGVNRSVGNDGKYPNINLKSKLYELNRRDVHSYQKKQKPINTTEILSLESFKKEFPYGEDWVTSFKFVIPWFVGAERELLLKKGRYHFEFLQRSISHGAPQQGYPVISVQVSSSAPPFNNANFNKGTLTNWKIEGDAFTNQPVFIVKNPSQTLYYINTAIEMTENDYFNGKLLKENSSSSKKGRLISKEFDVHHPCMRFYLTGDNKQNKNYLQYIIYNGEQEAHSANIYPQKERVYSVIDLKAFIGKRMKLILTKEEESSLIFADLHCIEYKQLGDIAIKNNSPEMHAYDSFTVHNLEEQLTMRLYHSHNTHAETNLMPEISQIMIVKE
ncbi:MAG: glycosyltransferase family 39 protein [bacterium]